MGEYITEFKQEVEAIKVADSLQAAIDKNKEAWNKAEAEIKAGRVICLSDLISGAELVHAKAAEDAEASQDVVKIIYNQINGPKLRLFTTIKIFKVDALTLGLSKGIKRLYISYNEGADDYTIKKTTLSKKPEIKTIEGIYCDQLEDIITEFFKILRL